MLASLFTGSTFRYVFMPQFLPRMSTLMFGGFQYFPYLLAIVFRNARLLPANHPYLSYGNAGRFGVRHVMAQAGSNLRFSLANIDQIVLFLIVIAAIVLVVVQILSIGAFFFLSSAMALPTNWNDFFVIQNAVARSQDIASILLDMVFGVPYLGIVGPTGSFSFFESCIGMPGAICTTNSPLVVPDFIVDIDLSLTPAAGLPADEFSPLSTNANTRFPFPYHRGLHSLFGVYSQGLLVVAVIILSYFIATVLAETAQTGTPFGRRYNKLWVPVRIVMAFGLLMPLGGNPISAALGVGTGLNSAQYVVLYAAKYGSAFASNGWRIFNDTIGQPYLGDVQDLVSIPNPPDVTGFLHFMYVVNVCEQIYEFYAGSTDTVRMWVHGDELSGAGAALQIDGTTTYNTAVAQLGGRGRTMVISFGEQDATKYEKERGNIMPLCGQIRWTLADARPGLTAPPAGAETPVYVIQEVYWRIMRDLWHNNTVLTNVPPNGETTGANRRDIALVWREIAEARPTPCTASEGSCTPHGYQVDQNFKRGVEEAVKLLLRTTYATVPASAIVSASWAGPWSGPVSQLYFKGWGAAGIWYNSIAAMNGNITFAALNPPTPSRYPSVMERVREIKMKHETNMSPSQMFNPNVPGLQDISGYVTEGHMNKVAQTLYAAYRAWDPSEGSTTQNRTTKNPIIDMISAIFGTNGLYAMRNNPSVHPLAQLVGIGASLVHTAARNLGIAGIATVTGIGLGDIVEGAGSLGSTLGSLAVSIASIAMTIGFVLYYVLPFLPFVYFFFALGGWVKGIFEALVGAPLWALAHIRIDGQGLPGNAALNGYFLIFEIFVRPILILFGFLASISIFSALVSTLHSVFPLMTSNLSGFEGDAISDPGVASIVTYMRGRVDQFFFTIMYAVMVYMIGMSSFKLIDLIPNNILRWMGQSVATFNDMREDAVQGLMSRASMGAQQVVPKVAGGLNSVIAAAKS